MPFNPLSAQIIEHLHAALVSCAPEHAVEAESADAVGRAIADLSHVMLLPTFDAMLSPDEAFRRSVDVDRKKLLDRIAAVTAGERPDNDVIDSLESDLLRVERGELALYVSEVRLLQTARDADGPLHEHSSRLRDIAVDATAREQAWRILSGRLGAMQAELQVRALDDGGAGVGAARALSSPRTPAPRRSGRRASLMGTCARATRTPTSWARWAATSTRRRWCARGRRSAGLLRVPPIRSPSPARVQEIEDTQRQMLALAQRLQALQERRFRIVNSAETERL